MVLRFCHPINYAATDRFSLQFVNVPSIIARSHKIVGLQALMGHVHISRYYTCVLSAIRALLICKIICK